MSIPHAALTRGIIAAPAAFSMKATEVDSGKIARRAQGKRVDT
jgi:hypothetical protein